MTNNKVSVQTQFADGLPFIQGDRVQLQQVMLNLIINAVEAMTEMGEGSRRLLIGTRKEGSDGLLVTAQDSEPGLHPDSLDNLFDAFYTTKPDGMGMGLSICRSIVEAHGGRLSAGSHLVRERRFSLRRLHMEKVTHDRGNMKLRHKCIWRKSSTAIQDNWRISFF